MFRDPAAWADHALAYAFFGGALLGIGLALDVSVALHRPPVWWTPLSVPSPGPLPRTFSTRDAVFWLACAIYAALGARRARASTDAVRGLGWPARGGCASGVVIAAAQTVGLAALAFEVGERTGLSPDDVPGAHVQPELRVVGTILFVFVLLVVWQRVTLPARVSSGGGAQVAFVSALVVGFFVGVITLALASSK